MRVLRQAYFRASESGLKQINPDEAALVKDVAVLESIKELVTGEARRRAEDGDPGYFYFDLPKMAERMYGGTNASRLIKPLDLDYRRLASIGEHGAGEGETFIETLEPYFRPWIEEADEEGRSIIALLYSERLFRVYELALPL
jgi:hypothetical protein